MAARSPPKEEGHMARAVVLTIHICGACGHCCSAPMPLGVRLRCFHECQMKGAA